MHKKYRKRKKLIKDTVIKFAPMLAALFVALLSYFCRTPLGGGTVEASAGADFPPTVIVDAGHGGLTNTIH